MCQECPGVITNVQERVEDPSPGPQRPGAPVEKHYRIVTKRVMQPCKCYCNTKPLEHYENGRAFCPACQHALRMH